MSSTNAPSSSMLAFLVVLLTPGIATLRASASMSSPQFSTMRLHYARHHYGPCQNNNQSSIISRINSLRINEIRGGGGGSDNDFPAPKTFSHNGASQQQQNPPQQMEDSNFQSAPSVPPTVSTANGEFNTMDGSGGGGASYDPRYEYRETVEDRIDAWRRQQQQQQQTQSAAEAASVVDDKGRFKLFTTVSRVSVSFFFFILMWRTVHNYELADSTFGSGRGNNSMGIRAALLRTVVVTPLVVLFLGEMMGAIMGVAGSNSSSHATKKRLKGILNLHKGVELVMMSYNVVRLSIWPSKHVVREIYIGRTISNFFFLMQAQLYTKLSWDDVVSKSTVGEGGYATESYYDDYTPETTSNYDDFSSWQSSSTSNGGVQQQHHQQQQQQQRGYQQNYDENAPGWS